MTYLYIYFSVSSLMALIGLYGAMCDPEIRLLKRCSKKKYRMFLLEGFIVDMLIAPLACIAGLIKTISRK